MNPESVICAMLVLTGGGGLVATGIAAHHVTRSARTAGRPLDGVVMTALAIMGMVDVVVAAGGVIIPRAVI